MSNQENKKQISNRSLSANILIVILSIGLIIWAIRLLQSKFTSINSLDAVVNGVVIDIKTPQEGIIKTLNASTGSIIEKDSLLLSVENDQVSNLQVKQISSRLSSQKSQLAIAEGQLKQLLSLTESLQSDDKNQKRLEVSDYSDRVEQYESDLRGVIARLKLTQVNYDRAVLLQKEGAYSQSVLDLAKVELQARQSEVESLEARRQSVLTNREAASFGLTLDRTRSNYDPRVRLEDVQLQIDNLQRTIVSLRQSITDAQGELTEAEADVERRRNAIVKAPVSGVIWKLDARKGQLIRQEKSVGQMIDCSRRWVDVYVEEQSIESIQIGMPAKIELYGASKLVLNGKVSLIRSGLGRFNAGEDVAITIPQNLPRTTQVRVELDKNSDVGDPNVFCYIGYTGKVTLNK
jgi:multidrug resistance efflux pump